MTALDSNDKRPFDIITIFCSVMLHFVVPVATEVVKAKAVGFGIDNIQQSCFESDKLCWVHFALEDGVLNPLAIVEASFGRATQAGFSDGRAGRDIVSDEDIHEFEIGNAGLARKKRRISIKIAPKVPGQKASLKVRQKPDGYFLVQKRVVDFILFALLPSG